MLAFVFAACSIICLLVTILAESDGAGLCGVLTPAGCGTCLDQHFERFSRLVKLDRLGLDADASLAALAAMLWISHHLYRLIKVKTRLTDWDDFWHVNVTARLRRARRSLFMQRFDSLLAAWPLWLGACLFLLLLASCLQPSGLQSDLPAGAWRTHTPTHLIWQKPIQAQSPSAHGLPSVNTAGSLSVKCDADTSSTLLRICDPPATPPVAQPPSLDVVLIDESDHWEATFVPSKAVPHTSADNFPYADSLRQNHLLYMKHFCRVPVSKADTALMPFRSKAPPQADKSPSSACPVIVNTPPSQVQLSNQQITHNQLSAPPPHASNNMSDKVMFCYLCEQPIRGPANGSVSHQKLPNPAEHCFESEKPLPAAAKTTPERSYAGLNSSTSHTTIQPKLTQLKLQNTLLYIAAIVLIFAGLWKLRHSMVHLRCHQASHINLDMVDDLRSRVHGLNTGFPNQGATPFIHVSAVCHHIGDRLSGIHYLPTSDRSASPAAGQTAASPKGSAHSHSASAEPTTQHASPPPARTPASPQPSSDQAPVQAVLAQGIAADRPVELPVAESVHLFTPQATVQSVASPIPIPGSVTDKFLSVAVQQTFEQDIARLPELAKAPEQPPQPPSATEDFLPQAARADVADAVLQLPFAESIQQGHAVNSLHQLVLPQQRFVDSVPQDSPLGLQPSEGKLTVAHLTSDAQLALAPALSPNPSLPPQHSPRQEAQTAQVPSQPAAVKEAAPAQYCQRKDISCLYIEADSDDEDGWSDVEYDSSFDDSDADDDADEFVILTVENGGIGMTGPH